MKPFEKKDAAMPDMMLKEKPAVKEPMSMSVGMKPKAPKKKKITSIEDLKLAAKNFKK